jgi:biopolymer transport protein ExbB
LENILHADNFLPGKEGVPMEFLVKLFHAFNPSSDAYLFMWAILITGVFSLSIIIERVIYLNLRKGVKSDLFTKNILEFIAKDDIDAAINLCKKGQRMSLARVIKAGLDEAAMGADRIRNAVDESMLKIIPDLEKRTGYLAVIGNVSTLLGLLGTVYGLIMSFAAVGRPGIDAAQKSELLASGIATAMNSTFSGLSIAIASIVVFAILKSKTKKIIDELDEHSLRVVNALIERSFKTQKFHFSAAQLKDGVGIHVTHNNIKIFTDNTLIKEITL